MRMMPRVLDTRLLGIVGLLVGIAAVMIGFQWMRDRRSDPASAMTPQQWQYSVTDGVRTATLLSRNRLAEPSPFKGGPATLSLARGPDGYIVKLDIDADMACGYAPTASALAVSFDGDPPRTFACAPAPDDHGKLLFDGAHSTAYLADPVGFLARLRNARRVRINGEFARQAAPQAMEFDLPPVDAIAEISPTSVRLAQAPAAASAASLSALPAADTAAAPPPKAVPVAVPVTVPVAVADVVAGNRASEVGETGGHAGRAPAIRVFDHATVRHHPRGYYLHPYRPVPGRAVNWRSHGRLAGAPRRPVRSGGRGDYRLYGHHAAWRGHRQALARR